MGIKDYCGILQLENSYDVITRIRPMTESAEIIHAIQDIEGGGGTNFSPALDRASRDLRALYTTGVVEKMHVVVITDGAAADFEDYKKTMELYRPEDGAKVSYSFMAIESDDKSMLQLQEAAELGGGGAYNAFGNETTTKLKEDICLPEVRSVKYGEFKPTLNTESSYGKVISQEDMPSLYGFYGTRAKDEATVILSGEYGVPVYAEWNYGKGVVGSFMCDLKGTTWSKEFMTADAGKAFITAVVKKIFPAGDISPKNLSINLREDNYTTQISIYPNKDFAENEYVTVSVRNLSNESAEVLISQPTEADGFSRASFIAKEAGIYEIKVSVMAGESLKEEYILYKNFSYSREYLAFDGNGEELMNFIAEAGGGNSDVIGSEDMYNAFEGFITSLHRSFDPRFVFIIVALVLFLLNVAVRKFKFKWPHEIIRDAIEKRKSK